MQKLDHWRYFLQLFILVLFLSCDLWINCTAEYKEFASLDYNEIENVIRSNKIHLLLCTLQVLAQLSSFTVIFALVCHTFPFQIGLIGVLSKRFSFVLLLQGLYFAMTVIVSGMRLVRRRIILIYNLHIQHNRF